MQTAKIGFIRKYTGRIIKSIKWDMISVSGTGIHSSFLLFFPFFFVEKLYFPSSGKLSDSRTKLRESFEALFLDALVYIEGGLRRL